jgi:hypothetical protein
MTLTRPNPEPSMVNPNEPNRSMEFLVQKEVKKRRGFSPVLT